MKFQFGNQVMAWTGHLNSKQIKICYSDVSVSQNPNVIWFGGSNWWMVKDCFCPLFNGWDSLMVTWHNRILIMVATYNSYVFNFTQIDDEWFHIYKLNYLIGGGQTCSLFCLFFGIIALWSNKVFVLVTYNFKKITILMSDDPNNVLVRYSSGEKPSGCCQNSNHDSNAGPFINDVTQILIIFEPSCPFVMHLWPMPTALVSQKN